MDDFSKHRQTGTWKWGLLCLIFLAPFFFLTYGFANQYAARLIDVPSITFAWEHHIPLWTWTIVPYWSIDLFYGLSLLLCWTTFELKQHVLRLFTAQLISISCFLLFPLKFSFDRPELSGFFGMWFDVLMGFDKPFNQAPSLHIVLLVILWDFYRRHIKSNYRWIVDIWSFLIGLSVLTTWQHHFIDIPIGLWVGALCLWLFPFTIKAPYQKPKPQQQHLTSKHITLASFYLLAVFLLIVIAWQLQGITLWLLYPASSLLLVALAYFLVRPHFFQKQDNGQMTIAAWMLFAPYFVVAWLNSRFWTRKHPEDSLILQQQHFAIYLGRVPNYQHAQQFQGLFDCCAELPIRLHSQTSYQLFATLDLIPVQHHQLTQAVAQFNHLLTTIATHQSNQKILIYCALGYSRSCSILIAWLLQQNFVENVEDAIRLIQKTRPYIVLSQVHLAELVTFQQSLRQESE